MIKGGLQKGNLAPKLMAKRVVKLCADLKGGVWENRQPVQVLGGPVNKEFLPVNEAKKQRMRPVKPGEYFGPANANDENISEWRQRWFKIRIPAAKSGEKGRRALFWDCRGEATVYINNAPWAGLDVHHPYCVIPDHACDLWIDNGLYQTAIWCEGKKPDQYGLRFDGAWIACRNPEHWDVYWDMQVLIETLRSLFSLDKQPFPGGVSYIPEMTDMSPISRKLVRRLHETCDVYENGGIKELARELKAIYAEFPAETWQIDICCSGHGHLDLVWYWPEKVGERKGAHTASTMLRLIDSYPEFKGMMTQPAMYKALQKSEPDLYKQIKSQMSKNRWEATGGMWVEADNILPCGEALARSLILGQRAFAELNSGKISTNVWLPDVFGYTSCLPQLMKLSGIESFFTTKLRWSEITKFPYDSMIWRGHDGSEVLAHMMRFITNYGHAGYFRSMAREFRQADVHNELLCPVGAGDGGGGPNEDDCERFRRMTNLAQVPRVKWGTVESFFDRMEKTREKLPVFEGEFYLELHRGTFTSQNQFKYWNRFAERALQANEAARVTTGKAAMPTHPWERVCFAHFHDAIPGSSINDVYREMTPELRETGQTALAEAEKILRTRGGSHILFNPLPFPRKAVVEIPENTIPVPLQKTLQKSGKNRFLGVAEIDGLGSITTSELKANAEWEVSSSVLDNGLVRAGFDGSGRLRRLTVNEAPLALAGAAEFMLHTDNPSHHDAWEIDQHTVAIGQRITGNMQLKVVEHGPVRAKLRGSAQVGEKSRMTVEYILEAANPWLLVNLEIDWHESYKLLRYQVPTGYMGRYTRYGAPFGSVLRQQKPGVMETEGMWEAPASRWAAVTEESGGEGLAIVTEAKYGYSCRDGMIGISLLKSSKSPDPEADMGRHNIRFAIGKHEILMDNGILSTPAAAESLFTPVLSVTGSKPITPPFSVKKCGTLIPYWTLPSDTGKGFVLRLHETMGRSGSATLKLNRTPESVQYTDFLERPLGKVHKLDSSSYQIEYKPYQIISVLVR